MTDATKKTVASPSADYHAHENARLLVRALMAGTHAMRAAREAYLPKEGAETDTSYTSRLSRTVLFNAFRKTVKDMAGRIFAKPIAIGNDMPELLGEYAENIDLTGRNLNTFAFEISKDALAAGISFILVDMPPPGEDEKTRADEIDAGRRPYWVHVQADDLIGWKSAMIEGKETQTQIRLRETVYVEDPDHPFEDIAIQQIRVLEPGSWQIWRELKDADGKPKWVMVEEGQTSLTYIPLVPVYFNRTGFMTGCPPLQDLADLNVAHWQSTSDQRNIVHVARVPILFGAGFDETTALEIGPGTLCRSSAADAKLTYVEHTGAAIGSGREDLKDLEFQMQAMGLQLLIPNPGQTATGEHRDDCKENSPLAMMAHALQDALEEAFDMMGEYAGMGEDAAGSVTVNTDFSVASRDVTDQQTLLAAAQNGLIQHETWLKEMKRRGILADDLDEEDEIEKLAAMPDEEDALDPAAQLRPGKPGAVSAALGGETGGKPGETSFTPETSAPQGPPQSPAPAPQAPAHPPVDMAAIEQMILNAVGSIKLPEAPAPQAPAQQTPPVINVHVDAPTMPVQEPSVVNVQVDAPTISLPQQEPPVVTVNVDAPEVNIAPPSITVEAPQVNVTSPTVNVAPPSVTVEAPQVTVESPQITVNAPPEGPSVTTVLETDADGGIRKFQKVPVAPGEAN